ncbi:MAG: LamG domain-containing protein, partial [Proteobacteria bacterium]|nr:LamG domain-containing protein [Pseudomonadota bacterium]MBU1611267.1 LamG domain-containing protein [Pseudomonadota bacterium]
ACSGLLMNADSGGQAEIPSDSTLNLTSKGSISCWVYMNSFNTWGGIIHKGESQNSNHLGIFSDETYSLQFTGDDDSPSMIIIPNNNTYYEIKATTNMQEDTWYHIAATWDQAAGADELVIYINGVEERSLASLPGPARSTASSMTIGAQFGDGDYAFDGIVDELYIYNRQLSAAEVLTLYNDGLRQP